MKQFHRANVCLFIALIVNLLAAVPIEAQVNPANIFADHMVLQRDVPIHIWGTMTKGATVSVEFAGQKVETKTDEDGKWRLALKPMKASSDGRQMTIRADVDAIVLKDILVGEVWFAGGQSNMAYTSGEMAKRLPEGKAMVDRAQFPAMRFRRISDPDRPTPAQDLKHRQAWTVCSPETIVHHSAVAFCFAHKLHDELNVPIGIIDCSWGGTPIEPYIPTEAFTGHPTLEKLAALAKAGDLEGIKKLPGGTFARSPKWLAGAIYNGRIAPVAPYAIRGAIWYQGESNCGVGEDPRDYEHKMRALIKGWRSVWGQEDMPFYYVQLPQWRTYAWTYLREEQRRAMDVKNAGMVVTIDLDNANDIHPPNKIDVGDRLARWPLAKVYGRRVPFSGPMLRDSKVDGSRMILTFDYAERGLMAGEQTGIGKFVASKEGTEINGFELGDSRGIWHQAHATIEGNTITLESPFTKEPVAARYACYSSVPKKDRPWNLYNTDGLPASPFCTDWKLMAYDPARNPMPR